MAITGKNGEGGFRRATQKSGPLPQEKNCHLTWGLELFSSCMAAAQNDADTKVTSLVDYLFLRR
jgi:hypothetical protein